LDGNDGRGTHIKEIELAVWRNNSWLVALDGSPFKLTGVVERSAGCPITNVQLINRSMLVHNIDLRVRQRTARNPFLPWVLNLILRTKRKRQSHRRDNGI
jgi:hypothetical protein